ncbi:alanine racemase [Gordonia sp. NPDC003425]
MSGDSDTGGATPGLWARDPELYWSGLTAAVRDAGLDSPVVVIDADAMSHNISDLERRAAGVPLRLATKSLRVRSLITTIAARSGFAGLLAFDLAEAHWLATEGLSDILLGYPTVRRTALARFLADPVATERVTLLVDDPTHLDIIDSVVAPGRRPTVRVAIDLDASLRLVAGQIHIGARRSPVHTADEAMTLGRHIVARNGFDLVGVMSYEAQVAGTTNATPGTPVRNRLVTEMQRRSMDELRARRPAVIAQLRELADLQVINAGGTGSIEETGRDPSITDIAVGSGVFGGHLFDGYAGFRPAPAMAFALDVVRIPGRRMVTCAGGGWIASGPPHRDRLPRPVWPKGLRYIGTEGAGEVQTPLRGKGTVGLRIGDRVWFRHTKSGEICERTDEVAVVERGASGEARVTDVVATYRGEGRCFL